jgi:hypothetical protein
MKTNRLLLCCAAALLACSGQVSASKPDSEAVRIIQQYVATHKGWRTSDYRIERHGRKDAYVMYFIIYLPEQRHAPGERKPLVAGGGESFAVYYDPTKRKVVREMGFE